MAEERETLNIMAAWAQTSFLDHIAKVDNFIRSNAFEFTILYPNDKDNERNSIHPSEGVIDL
jgi:hypothetical protein